MINDKFLLNNDKNKKNVTEAQKRAKNKYDKTHYKTITTKIKFSDYDYFSDYASKNNLTISKLIYNCIKYCMQNDIKFNE